MSDGRVVPWEAELHLTDEAGALRALQVLGPVGLGSIIHDRVPEAQRDLAWWFEEWGWVLGRGIYGDWTDPDDDEAMSTATSRRFSPGSLRPAGSLDGQ